MYIYILISSIFIVINIKLDILDIYRYILLCIKIR